MTMAKKKSYEAYIEELESIIAEIENAEIPIDELTNKVKRAAELIKVCQATLQKTEDEVNEIIASLDGKE